MEKRRPWFRKLSLILFGGLLFLLSSAAPARQSTASVSGRTSSLPSSGVFLVFPFENAGASPRLEWIGEGLEELTIQRLSAAGQQVFSHEGRLDEMDRAGLPPNAKLSRAAMLHIAQDLDADYVVFGPVMLFYFTTIAVLGVMHILGRPEVILATLNPWHFLQFFINEPLRAFIVLIFSKSSMSSSLE